MDITKKQLKKILNELIQTRRVRFPNGNRETIKVSIGELVPGTRNMYKHTMQDGSTTYSKQKHIDARTSSEKRISASATRRRTKDAPLLKSKWSGKEVWIENTEEINGKTYALFATPDWSTYQITMNDVLSSISKPIVRSDYLGLHSEIGSKYGYYVAKLDLGAVRAGSFPIIDKLPNNTKIIPISRESKRIWQELFNGVATNWTKIMRRIKVKPSRSFSTLDRFTKWENRLRSPKTLPKSPYVQYAPNLPDIRKGNNIRWVKRHTSKLGQRRR